MIWSEILTFAFVASLLVMSPGPNGVLIAKTVPTSGKTAGFSNVAGFVTAFYLHGTLSGLGISFILVQSATAFTIVKLLGATYLVWIGIKALIAAFKGIETKTVAPAKKRQNHVRAYIEGFLTSMLNPKVSLFYLAAFPQFISSSDNVMMSSLLLVSLHAAINAVWFSAMVLVMSRLTTLSSSGTFQRALKAVTGVAFIGFGLKLASYKPAI
jgi:threonine/homoserine/homoserine lactone efflux protein